MKVKHKSLNKVLDLWREDREDPVRNLSLKVYFRLGKNKNMEQTVTHLHQNIPALYIFCSVGQVLDSELNWKL